MIEKKPIYSHIFLSKGNDIVVKMRNVKLSDKFVVVHLDDKDKEINPFTNTDYIYIPYSNVMYMLVTDSKSSKKGSKKGGK